LLDFTLNAYTALWFASYGPRWTPYGVVIGIVSDCESNSSPNKELPVYISSDSVEKTIAHAIAAHPDQLLLWRPHVGYDRMLAQQSLLAFATVTDNPWGSFGFARTDGGTSLSFAPDFETLRRDLIAIAIAIAVPPSLKFMMRLHAMDMFGYSRATLFPDLSGFCQWQASTQEFDDDMRGVLWSHVPGSH
jgi:hypothetical protein